MSHSTRTWLLVVGGLLGAAVLLGATPACFFDDYDEEDFDPCGNGQMDKGEECDDGYYGNSRIVPNACRPGCTLPRCGDGIVDHGERCEPDQWPRPTCEDAGYTAGRARCDDCQIDVHQCTRCGNGRAEGAAPDAPGWEACDGTDRRGLTCADLGLGEGNLGCTSGCTLDTSGCAQPGACGDGFVQNDESCDDGNLRPHDGCDPACRREAVHVQQVPVDNAEPDRHLGRLFYDTRRAVLSLWTSRELFELRDGQWQRRSLLETPMVAEGASVVYDSQREVLVLYGVGVPPAPETPRTWEYDGSGWTLVQTAQAPPARTSAALTYDSDRGVAVLFGGQAVHGYAVDDTWEYDGLGWMQRPTTLRPTARAAAAFAYDPERRRAVLYGGEIDFNDYTNDTWEWDGATWRPMSTAVKPPALGYPTAQQAVWDPRRSRVVLLQGRWATYFLYWQLWEWDGERWRETTPVDAPFPMDAVASMTWDASRDGLVILESWVPLLWRARWE